MADGDMVTPQPESDKAFEASGLACPDCSGGTSVKDSRPTVDGSAIRRRRHCESCGNRFTTFEVVMPPEFITRGVGNIVSDAGALVDAMRLMTDRMARQLRALDEANKVVSGSKR